MRIYGNETNRDESCQFSQDHLFEHSVDWAISSDDSVTHGSCRVLALENSPISENFEDWSLEQLHRPWRSPVCCRMEDARA